MDISHPVTVSYGSVFTVTSATLTSHICLWMAALTILDFLAQKWLYLDRKVELRRIHVALPLSWSDWELRDASGSRFINYKAETLKHLLLYQLLYSKWKYLIISTLHVCLTLIFAGHCSFLTRRTTAFMIDDRKLMNQINNCTIFEVIGLNCIIKKDFTVHFIQTYRIITSVTQFDVCEPQVTNQQCAVLPRWSTI